MSLTREPILRAKVKIFFERENWKKQKKLLIKNDGHIHIRQKNGVAVITYY